MQKKICINVDVDEVREEIDRNFSAQYAYIRDIQFVCKPVSYYKDPYFKITLVTLEDRDYHYLCMTVKEFTILMRYVDEYYASKLEHTLVLVYFKTGCFHHDRDHYMEVDFDGKRIKQNLELYQL